MENATKGLMIAGAILIAIVLIGIGVFLVSQAQGFMGQGGQQFDDMTVSSFNSPIEQYEGRQSGSNVKALLTKLNTLNLQITADDLYEQQGVGINLSFKSGSTDVSYEYETKTQFDATKSKDLVSARSKVNTGKQYEVILSYDGTTRLISNVEVKDYSAN